ncbi:UNVERIFIED_CONTAM: Retinitis pigmentosa 9 protein, partial [Gekko kuhli]
MSHASSRRGEERSGGGSGSLKRHRSHSESLPGGSSGGARKGLGGKEQKREKREGEQILESFCEKLPPGLIKENETKLEDCIPDVLGNENAREFLAHAPTKGLWMPLGKEVKVMQCNQKLEQFRVVPEDSMNDKRKNKHPEKEMRMQQLKKLLEDSIRKQTEEETQHLLLQPASQMHYERQV